MQRRGVQIALMVLIPVAMFGASRLLGGHRPIGLAVPDSNATAAGNFKQEQRLNSLALQYTIDAYAPNNRFGSAFASIARPGLQSLLDSGVAAGDTSLLLRMLGLNDLTGTNEPSLVVGVVNGAAIRPPGNPMTYNGASDLDWWYSQNASEIDAGAIPKAQLTGSIVSNALAVGPGSMILNAGPFGPLTLSNARIAATVGGVSTPLTSSNGFPPGHLPGELIDPGLQSFASMSAGKLAGNIRAASLAAAPIPTTFVTGPTSCSQGYSASNTWLDLLVGGCTFNGVFTSIVATQPDQSDPAAPVAGAGAPYALTRTVNAVTGCKDKNGAIVVFITCLNAAAYSAYFQFTSDRVIVDSDGDGVPDLADNCPIVPNANQLNTDAANTALNRPGADALGDACDDDKDGDGYTAAQEAAVTGGKNDLVYCQIMRADVDNDGTVSILDLAKVAVYFTQTVPPAPERYKQDADSTISILDLTKMAEVFTQHVTACPDVTSVTPTPTNTATPTVSAPTATRTPTATPTTAPVLHSNGLGQTYADAMPLGTPGNALTYNATMANEAAAAWPPAGTTTSAICTGASAIWKQTTTSSAVWIYTGALAGHVFLNVASNAGVCPTVSDPEWN
jgi:hypothetical protein